MEDLRLGVSRHVVAISFPSQTLVMLGGVPTRRAVGYRTLSHIGSILNGRKLFLFKVMAVGEPMPIHSRLTSLRPRSTPPSSDENMKTGMFSA
jgi:hypothetical protein